MITQQNHRKEVKDKALYQFSDDKVNWSKPYKLAYIEELSIWPYGSRDGQVYKFKRLSQTV